MIIYDQDPDIVRWGLHQLIDVCTPSNTGSCNSVTHYETDTDQVAYVREFYNNSVYMNNVENDAAIARVLQDELSQIASAEAFDSNNPEQQSVLVQDWLVPDRRQHNSACAEHVNGQKVDGGEHLIDVDISIIEETNSSKNEMGESDGILCSVSVASGEESPKMKELSHSFDIADESTLDGEVGKRIHQMVPIPHVPKINGEIPTEDEEISDHQRLLDRLKVYDLVENKVQGDGNCQFRSLSDQLYRTSEYHKTVRDLIVNQLKCYPEMYEGYVPMAYGDYLKRMSKSGEWGDHVTLQAAADVYGVKIFMITSFKDTCYIEILPKAQMSTRVIFLSFWAEVHYNSIYPEGEVPLPENKKRKKWWLL